MRKDIIDQKTRIDNSRTKNKSITEDIEELGDDIADVKGRQKEAMNRVESMSIEIQDLRKFRDSMPMNLAKQDPTEGGFLVDKDRQRSARSEFAPDADFSRIVSLEIKAEELRKALEAYMTKTDNRLVQDKEAFEASDPL